MTMQPLGQLILRALQEENSRVTSRDSDSTDLGEPEVGKRGMILMWYRNGRNLHVSCVSDTALIAASTRARIFIEILEGGYNV
jgi:hypothetical protein